MPDDGWTGSTSDLCGYASMFYGAWWEQSRCLSAPGPHAPFCGGLGRSLHAGDDLQGRQTSKGVHTFASPRLGKAAAAAAARATGACGVKMDAWSAPGQAWPAGGGLSRMGLQTKRSGKRFWDFCHGAHRATHPLNKADTLRPTGSLSGKKHARQPLPARNQPPTAPRGPGYPCGPLPCAATIVCAWRITQRGDEEMRQDVGVGGSGRVESSRVEFPPPILLHVVPWMPCAIRISKSGQVD